MSKRKSATPAPRPTDGRYKRDQNESWSTTVTVGDVSIYAFERVDRAKAIHLIFRDPKSTAADPRVKRRLPGDFSVRNRRGGIDEQLEEQVKRELTRLASLLNLGNDPFEPPPAPEPVAEVLTLRRAFRRVLDLTDGKYVTKDRRYDEVARARNTLEKVLGADIALVDALTPARVRQVWRTLAKQYLIEKKGGPRKAEVVVDALYSAAAWLEHEKVLPEDSFKRIKDWRAELKIEWANITKQQPTLRDEDARRHTEQELSAIFKTLDDPRTTLFRRLLDAAQHDEALAGAMRSGVKLDADGQPVAMTLHWDRGVRSPGRKRDEWLSRAVSQTIVLGPHQREALTAALRGYLACLEDARLRGEIADYPLFPAGELSAGTAPSGALTPIEPEGPSVLTVDPRFALAFRLGGEQRIGQVVRTTRQNLLLPGIDRTNGKRVPLHGLLQPPSARRKQSQPIALLQRDHDQIVWELEHGYLREFEAAYRAGRIDDYPMFPSLRLARGLAPLRENAEPISRTAALKMFHHIEEVAGVERVPGRGWYGVRRLLSDVVEDHATDERVQNALTANTKDVRRANYQDRTRAKTLIAAAHTREKIRGWDQTGGAPAPAEAPLLEALKAGLVGLSAEQLAFIQTMVASNADKGEVEGT